MFQPLRAYTAGVIKQGILRGSYLKFLIVRQIEAHFAYFPGLEGPSTSTHVQSSFETSNNLGRLQIPNV